MSPLLGAPNACKCGGLKPATVDLYYISETVHSKASRVKMEQKRGEESRIKFTSLTCRPTDYIA